MVDLNLGPEEKEKKHNGAETTTMPDLSQYFSNCSLKGVKRPISLMVIFRVPTFSPRSFGVEFHVATEILTAAAGEEPAVAQYRLYDTKLSNLR